MSDNRTTELLPCPFCGGNARLTTWTPTAASISCIMCGAHFNTYNKAEAIAAWNSRAERTCKLIDTTSPGNDDYWNSTKCSECGAEFTCAIFGKETDSLDAFYCPNCGRKVVG